MSDHEEVESDVSVSPIKQEEEESTSPPPPSPLQQTTTRGIVDDVKSAVNELTSENSAPIRTRLLKWNNLCAMLGAIVVAWYVPGTGHHPIILSILNATCAALA